MTALYPDPPPQGGMLDEVVSWAYRQLQRYDEIFNALWYAEYWEDLRFPATAINPPGGASDPAWDPSNGGWLFDASSTEVLYVVAQLPHSWKEGTVLRPHVHWEKSAAGAGNVLWQLRYEWSVPGQVRSSMTTINAATAVSTFDSNLADSHIITSLPDIDGADKVISSMLLMRLERVGGSGLDTYANDARLLEFDIHYKRDARGSEGEFRKRLIA